MITIRQITFLFFVAVLCTLPEITFSQIKVYERTPTDAVQPKGLHFDSDTRKVIDLSGIWDVSFNNGSSFISLNVPLCYEFKGDVIFKKNFRVGYDLIENYSFILFAEGINYESEIHLNNTFIIKHTGGYNSIIVPIDDGIVSTENLIHIKVNNELNNRSTIPLSNQVNYGKNYGGIYRNIYLLAVPKVFVFSSHLEYALNRNQLSLKNNMVIKTGGYNQQISSSEFSVKTEIFDDSTGSLIAESSSLVFTAGNFSSSEFTNTLNVNIPKLWSPENPALYVIRSTIKDKEGNVIDVRNELTGFRKVSVKKDHVELNDSKILINSVNYYENTPGEELAVGFSSVERDLNLIKEAGFNGIRVPGRTAHPYVVNLCNRIGLFLFQEIPFNEVPDEVLDDDYSGLSFRYLSSVILRDRNSPSVLAWGIGNDFNVTSRSFAEYVRRSKELSTSYDSRQVYYTTRNFHGDICEIETDIRGLNVFSRKTSDIIRAVDLFSTAKQQIGSSPTPVFISRYGVAVNNENNEGYANVYSTEYQAKFLVEAFEMIYNRFPATVMASFSDWNSERPLNFRQNANPNLVTEGIYTIYREPKLAAAFVSRVLHRQDYPKIMEGHGASDSSHFLIAIGVILNIVFFLFLVNMKKFRKGFFRFLYRPSGFFQQISDQLLIPLTLSVVMGLLISLGIGLFIASVTYFYRDNNLFDVILSQIITSDGMKIFVSFLSDSPAYSILFYTAVNLLLLLLSFIVIRFVAMFIFHKAHSKSILTVVCWSSLVLFPFMIIGTVIYNIALSNQDYIFFSLILLCLLHVLYIFRIIKGSKILMNLSYFKSYLYGIIFILLIYGSVYIYLKYFNGTINIVKLTLSYLS